MGSQVAPRWWSGLEKSVLPYSSSCLSVIVALVAVLGVAASSRMEVAPLALLAAPLDEPIGAEEYQRMHQARLHAPSMRQGARAGVACRAHQAVSADGHRVPLQPEFSAFPDSTEHFPKQVQLVEACFAS